MADKSSISKAFNTHFFEFVEDIINIFPENKDIKDSKTAFELFKKANPTSILKAWNFFVYTPYRDVIDAGNIDFFFDKDYKNDLTYMSNANEIVKIIDTLREPVKNMGDTNKDHAMKYIQNLSKLSDMYLAMK
jgi:hypothetical protein